MNQDEITGLSDKQLQKEIKYLKKSVKDQRMVFQHKRDLAALKAEWKRRHGVPLSR